MNFKFQVSGSKFRVLSFNFKFLRANTSLLFTFCFLFFISACSVPNLEKPECTAARQTVKEFYSLHFGNDMQPSEDYLRKREKFLTADWKNFISKNLSGKQDYFTSTTEDYPKAFRIGECQAANENKTVFQVIFFWKDDTRSEQRETRVEAVKENGKWLINRIFL